MQCLMSLHQALQGNKRKAKSPARHREAHRSRLVRLGCEVMEDRVLLSAALPDYHFTAPALVAGTTQNAPSPIGAFTKTPGGTTHSIVSNRSMQAVLPAAPSFTAKAVSGTQINLAWTPVAGATGYEIKINGGDYEGNCNLSSNYTSYAVTGLSPNTTYNLDVAAYNAAGTTWANSQSATTLSQNTAPAAPSFMAMAVSATQINLAWTPVAGATGYLVDELVNGAWKQIGSLGSSSTGCTVNGLSPNTTYHFKVGAYNAAGTTWANSQSATTLAATLTPPAAPSFTATAVSATQINLAWTPVHGATGYLVDELINGVQKQIGSLGSGSTGCAVTGLSPNTTYSFKVGASNAAGTTWANSQSATTFPVSPGPKPCPWVIDHPLADDTNGQLYNYQVVNGTLFGSSGPVYTDVQQTIIADCWLLAPLAEAAARAPQDIQRMFTDLGTYMENGVQVHVWSVHFYDTTGVSRSVIVDNELPVNSSGKTMSDQVNNGVLWVALAEKAYIQAAALGYVALTHAADDSYMSINFGDPANALAAITGHQATDVSIDASGIDYDFSVGDLVVIATGSITSSSLMVPNHCYAVIDDNPTGILYTVFNPWNAGFITTDGDNIVYGSTFYCVADFINANWDVQASAEA